MGDITQTDRELVASRISGTSPEDDRLRKRILSGESDGRVIGILNDIRDDYIEPYNILHFSIDSPEIKHKKDTFKKGDRVYLPKLGDSPEKYGIYQGHDGWGESSVALIQWNENYKGKRPLRYVELCPVQTDPPDDGMVFILILMVMFCIMVIGGLFR